MLRSGGFNAILEKMAPLVKRISKESAETVTKTALRMRVSVTGDSQYFLQSFQDKTRIGNVQSLFDDPIVWERIRLNLRDYDSDFTVTLEDVEFDAKLVQIDVSRKTKNGIDKYTYILSFEKEEDATIDSIMSNQYLKRYTTDRNDKKVLAEYNVTMAVLDQSKSGGNTQAM